MNNSEFVVMIIMLIILAVVWSIMCLFLSKARDVNGKSKLKLEVIFDKLRLKFESEFNSKHKDNSQ